MKQNVHLAPRAVALLMNYLNCKDYIKDDWCCAVQEWYLTAIMYTSHCTPLFEPFLGLHKVKPKRNIYI